LEQRGKRRSSTSASLSFAYWFISKKMRARARFIKEVVK
jgi:hypothetical protein